MNCSVPIDVVVKGWNDIKVVFDAPKIAVLVGTTAGFQLVAVLKVREPGLSSQVASCAYADVAASKVAAVAVVSKYCAHRTASVRTASTQPLLALLIRGRRQMVSGRATTSSAPRACEGRPEWPGGETADRPAAEPRPDQTGVARAQHAIRPRSRKRCRFRYQRRLRATAPPWSGTVVNESDANRIALSPDHNF